MSTTAETVIVLLGEFLGTIPVKTNPTRLIQLTFGVYETELMTTADGSENRDAIENVNVCPRWTVKAVAVASTDAKLLVDVLRLTVKDGGDTLPD